jgi:coenzyme F420 hydrogenase subunit beta
LRNIVEHLGFLISIFCGSNFELEGTEFIIKRIFKVKLDDVARISHRDGIPKPGDFVLETKEGEFKTIPWISMDYILGLRFMRDRCRECPDQSGELADISVGDPRPPIASPDSWSAAYIRTEEGKEIFEGAVKAGFLVESVWESRRFFGQLIPVNCTYGKKYANWLRIEKRRRYGWSVPTIY